MWLSQIRPAIRSLWQWRSFTLTAVLILALGFGTTTAIFTVVESVLLRPLPFPESDRVFVLCETNPKQYAGCVASPANVDDWSRAARLLDNAGVARNESFIGRDADGAFGVRGGIASPGFFRVLRMQAAQGRLFSDEDMRQGANQVAIVSERFWRTRLGGDRRVVGGQLLLDGKPFTVVGVLPEDAYVPQLAAVDVWKPLTASIDDVGNRNWRGFLALGRVRPAARESELTAELQAIVAGLKDVYPDSNRDWGVRLEPLRTYLTGSVERTLWLFFGAVALVLLIACANVASLLLVQATRRQSEFAVRAALGASRARLIRQAMTETALLSFAGSVGGLALASWLTRVFLQLAPPTIPRLSEIVISWRIAGLALGLATVTAAVVGLAPAWRIAMAPAALRPEATPRLTARGSRSRSMLVVAELALALVLFVGAGLLARAFLAATSWEPGFDRANVAVSWMLAPTSIYKSADSAVTMLRRARDEVAAIPNVEAVALASAGPLFGGVETGSLTVVDEPGADASHPPVNWFDVDEHYFRTLGVRVIRGRGFSADDRTGSPNVALVNETLARRYFGDASPLGRRVTVMKHTSEIVGVVADVRPSRPDRPIPAEIYWPIQQYQRFAAYLVIRTAPGTAGLEAAVRARVASVEPGAQVTSPVLLDTIFDRTLVGPRFTFVLIGVFAAIAVVMALTGVAGVMAFAVASRTREIGVRMAMGATPGRLVAEFVRQGLAIAAASIAIGTIAALWLSRSLGTLLIGVPSYDPLTFAVTLSAFFVVSTLACYLPARRASRVDPLISLRAD